MVEIFFGTGIPMVGFICAVKNADALLDLCWFYPLLLLTGWHVVTVNDICFDRSSFKFSMKYFPSLVAVPLILACMFFLKPVFIAIMFLIILNWNVYSFYGKFNWITGLFYNFSGGILHFLAGVTAAGRTDIYPYLVPALFFGFAMLSGAIHHDACHYSEDSDRKYKTGAVVFGELSWWRIGIVPMLAGIISLLNSNDMLFMFCFCVSSSMYLVMYSVMSTWKFNNYMLYFRILCRLAFAMGAIAYIVVRLLKMS
ncbi:MAG TPA: hypothetical protein DET40_06615 [Lentisphaeria bacterium]|nr:MAG: hypothetical protein A2X45_17510 [Lentisphaerae bacterium GWF2_50_93]HCE43201.1 hypothetical protein [Lentisphaeria bacterium]